MKKMFLSVMSMLSCVSIGMAGYAGVDDKSLADISFVAAVLSYQGLLGAAQDEAKEIDPASLYAKVNPYRDAYRKIDELVGRGDDLRDLNSLLYPIYRGSLKPGVFEKGKAALEDCLVTNTDMDVNYFANLFSENIYDLIDGVDFDPDRKLVDRIINDAKAKVEKSYHDYLEAHPDKQNQLAFKRAARVARDKLDAKTQRAWEAENKVRFRFIAAVVSYGVLLERAYKIVDRHARGASSYREAWYSFGAAVDYPLNYSRVETIDEKISKAMEGALRAEAFKVGLDAGLAFLNKAKKPVAATAELYADKIRDILKPIKYNPQHPAINTQIEGARMEVRSAYFDYIKEYPDNVNLLNFAVEETKPVERFSRQELLLPLGVAGTSLIGLYQIASWLLR